MKKIIIIVAIAILGSCKALDKLTMFNLKYDTKFTLPANNIVGRPIDLTSPEMTTNTEEEFAIHDTRKDLIEEIKLKELTLTIENRAQTFDFLESVTVYITAEGLPEIKVAEKLSVPKDIQNELKLDVFDDDLAPYLKKEKIAMRVITVADGAVTEDLAINLHSVFRVDAKILGL